MIGYKTLFSKNVFTHFVTLALGAILSSGRRTVCGCLATLGMSGEKKFHKYHRVLGQSKWCALTGARILLGQLVCRFGTGDGPLIFCMDETIERRWGPKIKKRGIYRDAVRSSKGHFVKCSGLRWVCMMLVAEIPWAKRRWALPFLTVLAPSERHHATVGKRHKKVTDWAAQMSKALRRWLPGRELVVVGDRAYASLEFLADVRAHVTFIAPLRLDAALFAPAPCRPAGKRGRGALKGERLPTPQEILSDENTPFEEVEIALWYGHANKKMLVSSGTAIWYHTGKPPVHIRWAIVKDPDGVLKPRAYLSTDQSLGGRQIVEYYCRRWNVEVTFEEARAHLGVESQRQWSDLSILRTTPLLLGAFSQVALWADSLAQNDLLVAHKSAWYDKPAPTFSDALACVRTRIWEQIINRTSPQNTDMVVIPRAVFMAMANVRARAA